MARLSFRRHHVVAEYAALTGRWRVVQAAILASLGLGFVGWYRGAVRGLPLLALLVLALVLRLGSKGFLHSIDREFAHEMGFSSRKRLKDEEAKR